MKKVETIYIKIFVVFLLVMLILIMGMNQVYAVKKDINQIASAVLYDNGKGLTNDELARAVKLGQKGGKNETYLLNKKYIAKAIEIAKKAKKILNNRKEEKIEEVAGDESLAKKFFREYKDKNQAYYDSLTPKELEMIWGKIAIHSKVVNADNIAIANKMKEKVTAAAQKKDGTLKNGEWVFPNPVDQINDIEEAQKAIDKEKAEAEREVEDIYDGYLNSVYTNPLFEDSNTGTSQTHSSDEIIEEAEGFLASSEANPIDEGVIKKSSDTIYNILLSMGVITAVAVGTFLAAKFMMSSVEEKAEVKKLLIPYIVGCVLVFGAFGIWRMVVNIASSL